MNRHPARTATWVAGGELEKLGPGGGKRIVCLHILYIYIYMHNIIYLCIYYDNVI